MVEPSQLSQVEHPDQSTTGPRIYRTNALAAEAAHTVAENNIDADPALHLGRRLQMNHRRPLEM